jgi:hypothetical protein
MFVIFFNSHAIKNQILIIVLEGTLRHKQTHKNNSFWLFQNNFFFKLLSNFRIFMSKHTNMLKNTLKTLKTARNNIVSDR